MSWERPNLKIIVLTLAVVIIAILAVSAIQQRGGKGNQLYCGPEGQLQKRRSIQSHRSYCLFTASATVIAPDTATPFAFQVIDDRGSTLTNFDVVHERSMHVIVVRHDRGEFLHLHPDFDPPTGTFTLRDLNLPGDGQYRLFGDFTPTDSVVLPDGRKLPVVASVDLSVGDLGKYTPQPIGEIKLTDSVDDFSAEVKLNPAEINTGATVLMAMTIKRQGATVNNLERYLGELGHAVAIGPELQYVHTHARGQDAEHQTGTIEFEWTPPTTGSYKLFVQFQHESQVRTADFTISVQPPGPAPITETNH